MARPLSKIAVASTLFLTSAAWCSGDTPKTFVSKRVLENGLTVLVRPVHTVPEVSIQMWYGVGSKDERDDERGFAHLTEHMIFKGTEKLSETDISAVTHKLAGRSNACTSPDHTTFTFDLPTHNWQQALPILADCMCNAAFRPETLNSELRAVIQELRMYRDDPMSSVLQGMLRSMFMDHPYHHPVIGYRHGLWVAGSEKLRRFYKRHYRPDNATLVVVGDVTEEEVFAAAQNNFGQIRCEGRYERRSYPHERELVGGQVTLHRQVAQPVLTYAYAMPGTKEAAASLSLLSLVMGGGRSSRLYKKLVDEQELVVGVQAVPQTLFDHSVFFVYCVPKSLDDADRIAHIIQTELDDVAQHGPTEDEMQRLFRGARQALYSTLESNSRQAQSIGLHYLATGDENYLFTFLERPKDELARELQRLVADYCAMPVMHRGSLLPLPETQQQFAQKMQLETDAQEQAALAARERAASLEEPRYALAVTPGTCGSFSTPKGQEFLLQNGIKVLTYHNSNTPQVEIHLELKADSTFDPWDKQGVLQFVSTMLVEGTAHHPGRAFAEALEQRCIGTGSSPGSISMNMLREDLPFALQMMYEMLTEAAFGNEEIEKVRERTLTAIRCHWDQPSAQVGQAIRERLYQGHPHSKSNVNADVVTSLSRDDLLDCYRRFVTPDGARIVIVGDIADFDLPALLQETLGAWHGPPVAEPDYPALAPVAPEVVNHQRADREQVLLCWAGHSLRRTDPDYDKLELFQRVFAGGLNSRLFKLREDSGLFYSIGSSLAARAGKQPGMVTVETLVAPDTLEEATRRISQTIDTAAASLTDDELREARDAITNDTASAFASNAAIASQLLFLDKYDLPADHFDTYPQRLAEITIPQVQEAVGNVLGTDKMFQMRVGRIPGLGADGAAHEPTVTVAGKE